MGAGATLALTLMTTLLEHATEIGQLIATANAEGRDVTTEEIAAIRGKAVGAVDALEAAKR